MDWITPVVLLYLTFVSTLNQVQSIRLNPFSSFAGINYDPSADFGFGQDQYIPNMPMASIYPMMTDESLHTMVGIPSLKPQSVPFLNPFSSPTSQNPSQNVGKNTRSYTQRNSNIHSPQGNSGPPKNRGVTLDVRGGGYKVEKHQNTNPYKAPVAESSVRNTQRYSDGRNIGRQNNPPPTNRKPSQGPRGPSLKNPHYNMKFEHSLPSMPPNVEFVNPENVLPLHPRIYKPFLQQNKQYASYFQNLNKPKSPNGGNYGGSFQGSSYNQKPSTSKPTRSRENPVSSSLSQSSQFSNFAPNFDISGGEMPSPSMSSTFGYFQQQSGGKPWSSQFETLFNQDPSFYSSWSQTPEGQAILNQLQQSAGGSNNPKLQAPQNKPPQHSFQNANSPPYASSSMSTFPSGSGSLAESGIPSFTSNNYFGANQGLAQNDGINNQSPHSDYQQMMMYYQQQMQQPSQHQIAPQYPPSSGQSSFQGPASAPSYTHNQQYGSTQAQNNPYGGYQYAQGQSAHFQDQSQSFGNTPESATYSKSKVHPYEQAHHAHPYQASHKDIKSQVPPTADYYRYHHHKSQQYSADRNVPSFSQSALHVISPFAGEKTSADHSSSIQNNAHKSVSTPGGYLTPEQLIAHQSTGLQSEAKFGYPSAHGGSSPTASLINKESAENEAAGSTNNEHIDGGERAALHEYKVNYDPFSYEGSEKLKEQNEIWKKEVKNNSQSESESEEKLHETIQEFQKLLTKAPKDSYMVPSTDSTHSPTTTRVSAISKAPLIEESIRNHKTTPSYMFQYAPAEKTATKIPPTWHAWKPNASRYHLPLPEVKMTSAVTPPTTSSTTPVTTTQQTTTFQTTTTIRPVTKMALYHEPEKPVCARTSGKNYCLQDPDYPKDKIKEAIEKNRHPLDHFLVDISASTNMVEDTDLSKVFENSVPLQSTSISYSFEGKPVSPVLPANSTAGCSSSVYYVKPLRAINTAGVWRTIVNVEFEETGANYTQTVRMEECSHTPGYVASCGEETISACLQKYKLQRLLSWEENRGFYIDAFLLPHECFCGSQQR